MIALNTIDDPTGQAAPFLLVAHLTALKPSRPLAAVSSQPGSWAPPPTAYHGAMGFDGTVTLHGHGGGSGTVQYGGNAGSALRPLVGDLLELLCRRQRLRQRNRHDQRDPACREL